MNNSSFLSGGTLSSSTNYDSIVTNCRNTFEIENTFKVDKVNADILTVNNIVELRNLSSSNIKKIIDGNYKGVEVLGYYEKWDTPTPIIYYLSNTTKEDNGGSIIKVGNIKLEHKFTGDVDIKYFGAKVDGINDDTIFIQNALLAFDNVLLPEGETLVTNTLYVTSKNSISGKGSSNNYKYANSKINFKPNNYIDLFATDGSKDEELGYLFNIKFQNFSVTGDNTGRYLFNLPYMSNFYASNIKQFGGFHYFTAIDGWLDCNFENCSSQGTIISSIHCKLSHLMSTTVRFNNCYFSWGDIGIITEYNSINSLIFNSTIFESFNKILIQGNLTNVYFNNYYSENTPKSGTGHAFEIGFGDIGSNVELEKPSLYINGVFSQGNLNTSTIKSTLIKSNYARIIKISNIHLEYYENIIDYSVNTNRVILDSVGGVAVTYIGLPTNNWDNCNILSCDMPYTYLDSYHPTDYYYVFLYGDRAKYREFITSPIGNTTPLFIGEEGLDIVNKIWYKSTGTSNTDWVEL